MPAIGAHASIAGGVANAVDEQLEYGGTCGQIFTHSPRVWRQPPLDAEDAATFRTRSRQHDVGPWVIHASYLVNPATPDEDLRAKSIESLQREVEAAATLEVPYVNVHLGAHTGAGVDAGLDNAAAVLSALQVPDDVTVLVESDAGGGTKLGAEFAELAAVLERCDHELGVCLDTAHAFAAGYDLSTPSGVDDAVAALETHALLGRLACVHLNDSKHPCGSHRDEHAHVGEGHIGPAGMAAVLNHEALRHLPFVLETPTEDGKSFAWNVERARALREG